MNDRETLREIDRLWGGCGCSKSTKETSFEDVARIDKIRTLLDAALRPACPCGEVVSGYLVDRVLVDRENEPRKHGVECQYCGRAWPLALDEVGAWANYEKDMAERELAHKARAATVTPRASRTFDLPVRVAHCGDCNATTYGDEPCNCDPDEPPLPLDYRPPSHCEHGERLERYGDLDRCGQCRTVVSREFAEKFHKAKACDRRGYHRFGIFPGLDGHGRPHRGDRCLDCEQIIDRELLG